MPVIITGLSQEPCEKNTVSRPIPRMRKLRQGDVNIPEDKRSAWTMHKQPWSLSEGRCRLRGGLSAPPQPVTSRQLAGWERPRGAQGYIRHRSLATWPQAPGGRTRRRCSGWGEGSGSHTALVPPPLGLGRVPGIQPSTLVPAPAPRQLSAAWSQRCPLCFASVEPSASSQSK